MRNQEWINTIRRAAIAFLILWIAIPSFAQLNESDTANVQWNLGVNGIIQRGNVNVGILRSKAEGVVRYRNSLAFKTQNNLLYQEFGGYKADNDMISRNYFYYKPAERFYPFAMVYVQSNFRLKIKQRFFYGLGGTIQLLNTDRHVLKCSLSVVNEKSNYATSEWNVSYYSGKQTIAIWRPTAYIYGSHQWQDRKLKIHYYVFWQPGMDRVSNYRIQGECGIDLAIWKGLRLGFEFYYSYEEVVPKFVQQEDLLLTLGISYLFKK